MDTKNLSIALYELQSQCIGLFSFRCSDDYEMVIKNDDGLITCIRIGQLGGLQTTYIPSNRGKLLLFENGQTLTGLMKTPFKLREIIDSFKNNDKIQRISKICY